MDSQPKGPQFSKGDFVLAEEKGELRIYGVSECVSRAGKTFLIVNGEKYPLALEISSIIRRARRADLSDYTMLADDTTRARAQSWVSRPNDLARNSSGSGLGGPEGESVGAFPFHEAAIEPTRKIPRESGPRQASLPSIHDSWSTQFEIGDFIVLKTDRGKDVHVVKSLSVTSDMEDADRQVHWLITDQGQRLDAADARLALPDEACRLEQERFLEKYESAMGGDKSAKLAIKFMARNAARASIAQESNSLITSLFMTIMQGRIRAIPVLHGKPVLPPFDKQGYVQPRVMGNPMRN